MNYKICTRCKSELPATAEFFYRNKKGKFGLHSWCKECLREHNKNYYRENKDWYSEHNKNYYEQNKDWRLEYSQNYYQENRDWYKERNQKYYEQNKDYFKKYSQKYRQTNKDWCLEYQKQYYEQNKEKYAARDAKRRAAKLQATPKWLTEEHLEEIEWCYWLRNQDPKNLHVDHIIPLQGKNVSGLHVPWNLRVIPKEWNWSKSNKIEDIIHG